MKRFRRSRVTDLASVHVSCYRKEQREYFIWIVPNSRRRGGGREQRYGLNSVTQRTFLFSYYMLSTDIDWGVELHWLRGKNRGTVWLRLTERAILQGCPLGSVIEFKRTTWAFQLLTKVSFNIDPNVHASSEFGVIQPRNSSSYAPENWSYKAALVYRTQWKPHG